MYLPSIPCCWKSFWARSHSALCTNSLRRNISNRSKTLHRKHCCLHHAGSCAHPHLITCNIPTNKKHTVAIWLSLFRILANQAPCLFSSCADWVQIKPKSLENQAQFRVKLSLCFSPQRLLVKALKAASLTGLRQIGLKGILLYLIVPTNWIH